MIFKKLQRYVIIIGAGAAGLATASKLEQNGFKVLILEAKNVLGGRIRSQDNFAPFFLEAGAEELHGENSVYKQMVLDAGAKIIDEEEFDEIIQYKDKLYRYKELLQILPNDQIDLIDTICDDDEIQNDVDISILDYIKKKKLDMDLIHYYDLLAAREFGADMSSQGIKGCQRCFNNWTSGDKNFILSEKTHNDVLKYNFKNVLKNISYNCPVKLVDYSSKSKIKIHLMENQVLQCDLCVICVPINQIQQQKLQLIPQMNDSQQSSLNQIKMGEGGKVMIKLTNNFFGENICNISLSGTGLCSYIWNAKIGKQCCDYSYLNALISGQSYQIIKDLTKNEMIDIFAKDLEQAFKINVKQMIEDIIFIDWTKEQYIEGLYSYDSIGQCEYARQIASSPLDNRVFFAGEWTSSNHYATIHGAIEQGNKAANLILNLEKNQQNFENLNSI